MTKKKSPPNADVNGNGIAHISVPPQQSSTPSKVANGTYKSQDESPSQLCISRNKHWRYISAFHGPWLQLPHEILETLAHSNFLSPRPRQTDPAVLYDLLKIRKLVDEASDLAVRAQNGTASSALNNSYSAGNGMPGGALGLTYHGVGGHAKLSPERKFRMRELATQKLSQAYRLDEVAASVATMQSASTLDAVANLVLQRNPGNSAAEYVHFFHEKIPSRMMAEYTPLTALNKVIANEPGHPAPFRTRALVRIFKEDHVGAIQDLTEARALCKLQDSKHKAGRNQLVSMKTVREDAEKRKIWTRDWVENNRVAGDDQPTSLDMQLLFQRGNQYLTVACQYIRVALEHFEIAKRQKQHAQHAVNGDSEEEPEVISATAMEAYRRGLEAREMVRNNAKRALRDYMTFFSKLDYAYALAHHTNESPFPRYFDADDDEDEVARTARVLEDSRKANSSHQSTALVRHKSRNHDHRDQSSDGSNSGWSTPPTPSVHEISTLFSPSPPSDLPLFPMISTDLVHNFSTSPASLTSQHHEMITYHPFLPEVIHSFLLTHCLIQTPPTALLRHANNAARVARLADGYPFFLSARSPARADWCEILRKTNNWISLSASWENLCKAPQPPSFYAHKENGVVSVNSKDVERKELQTESKVQKRTRIHKEAVLDALGDDRVVDDETFQRAVDAREKRAWGDIEEQDKGQLPAAASVQPAVKGTVNGTREKVRENDDHRKPQPKESHASAAEPVGWGKNHGPVAKDEEYLIGTERAEAIAKWILEAPVAVEGASPKKKGAKKGKAKLKTRDTPDTGEVNHLGDEAGLADGDA